MGGWF